MSRAGRAHAGIARYAAPVAFLLGVTIVVLLIRSGLGGGQPATTTGPSTASVPTVTRRSRTTRPAHGRLYTVQTGDTFGSISAKTGTSVADLERLNPGISSNALQVGQKLHVK